MEGLEGLKILQATNGDIGSITILSIYLLIGIGAVIYSIKEFIKYKYNILLVILIIGGLLISVLSAIGIYIASNVILLEVTPIEDNYSIDFNKYNIVDNKGEIITLEVIDK